MTNSKSTFGNCGCCSGIEWLTPALIDNDHGLASLLYRIGAHGMFKESMLRSLSQKATLKELTTRENDDATIALFDVWALILDVLTFYNERIINEGYMLTSTERLSLVELAKHISYIPKPGVAAGSWVTFLTEESPGAPTEVNVPLGTRVQSIPGQDEKAQTFETTESIKIKTKWNAIRPKLTEAQILKKWSTRLYLKGTDNQLQPGDTILIVGDHRNKYPNSERWDIRTLHKVVINNDEKHTLISWQEGLGHNNPNTNPANTPLVYVFRQSAALFGNNAPDYRTMADDVKKAYVNTSWLTRTNWPEFHIKTIEDKIIHLDTIYPKILKGSWLALVKPGYAELYKALEVIAASRSDYTLTSKTSRILLDTNEHLSYFPLRKTAVYAQSEVLPIAKAPVFAPVFGETIKLDEAQPGLKVGQHIILSGELANQVQVTQREFIIKTGNTEEPFEKLLTFISTESSIKLGTGEILKVSGIPKRLSGDKVKWSVNRNGLEGYVIADKDDLIPYITKKDSDIPKLPTSLNQSEIISEWVEIGDLFPPENPIKITFTASLNEVYLRHTVVINANIAKSTHGETKTEILGAGNAAISFQKFYLKQKPLTYISSASASGIATTLEIRVDDIRWKEVSTFYKRTSEERIFITCTEDDGTTYVQFGNGITGTRLPSGQENIKATYRIGIGMEGLVKAGQLSMLLDPQLGIKSVTNPLPAAGAEDPESLDNIKRNAPLTVLTLDRIVSVEDCENFTSAFAGIGKARADLLWKGEDRTLHLTVAAADQGSIDKTLEDNLINAINGARHENYSVIINSFDEIHFNVKAKIKIHPDYLMDEVIVAVKETLVENYNFETRSFAQSVTPSEVTATIQSVDGVIAVDLDEVDGQNPFSVEHFRLVSNIARWDVDVIKPAELLLIDEESIEITLMD